MLRALTNRQPTEFSGYGEPYSASFNMVDFFRDMPWFKTPMERHTLFVAPLQRGGLLGGSGEGAPKMSKLQALAAARKKKAQEQKSSGDAGVEKPMAEMKINDSTQNGSTSEEAAPPRQTRGFPIRKRKDSNPHEKIVKEPPPEREPETQNVDSEPPEDQAEPSAFASTMFGQISSPTSRKQSSMFTLPYNVASIPIVTDPFSGPSPDDVVIAAQSQSKGVNSSAKVGKSKK